MVALNVRPIPISPPQKRFRESTKWLRGLCAGRGFGKTKIGCIDVLFRAKPREPWMAISPDNNMIRETTLPTFIETAEFTGQYVRHVVSPTPRVWFRTRYGGIAQIVFKGAEKPDKLRGPSKAGLWFDEASIICKEAFDIGIACCRYQGKMGPVLATFTPRGFKHWTFESFFQRVEDDDLWKYSEAELRYFQARGYLPKHDTELIHCSTRENPFAPPEFYNRIAANYSSMLAMQELEGDFIEISGLIFKREWFNNRSVDGVPRDAMRVRVWDKAASADSGCYTVGLLMARDRNGKFYVEDIIRGQWSYLNRNQLIKETAERDFVKYGGTVLTYIEQEGGGDGKSVMDQLIMMLAKFPVFKIHAGGGQWKTKGAVRLPGDAKIRRALPFAAQCEAGNVYVKNGAWCSDFLEELTAFPEYAYADQVDAASYAFNCLANMPQEHLFASRDIVSKMENSYGEALELENDSIARWGDLPWRR